MCEVGCLLWYLLNHSKSKDNNIIQLLFQNWIKLFVYWDLINVLAMQNGFCMSKYKSEDGITITQTKMINKLFTEFGMVSCSPVETPMEPGFQIPSHLSSVTTQEVNYPYQCLRSIQSNVSSHNNASNSVTVELGVWVRAL